MIFGARGFGHALFLILPGKAAGAGSVGHPLWANPRQRIQAKLLGRPSRFFSLGQLISRHRRACTANQPIRLFQNVGICRLFSSEEADNHEGCAKQQA